MRTIDQLFRRGRTIASLWAVVALTSPVCLAQTDDLPGDLELILPSQLPGDTIAWYSIQNWPSPPLPCNWCPDRADVSYYVSASLPGSVLVDARHSTP